MDRIGVRELRQNASRYLRRVQAGETIEVTDRGRPVARLIPPEPVSTRDRLVAEGKLVPAAAARDMLDIHPLQPGPVTPPLSATVEELREERLP